MLTLYLFNFEFSHFLMHISLGYFKPLCADKGSHFLIQSGTASSHKGVYEAASLTLTYFSFQGLHRHVSGNNYPAQVAPKNYFLKRLLS